MRCQGTLAHQRRNSLGRGGMRRWQDPNQLASTRSEAHGETYRPWEGDPEVRDAPGGCSIRCPLLCEIMKRCRTSWCNCPSKRRCCMLPREREGRGGPFFERRSPTRPLNRSPTSHDRWNGSCTIKGPAESGPTCCLGPPFTTVSQPLPSKETIGPAGPGSLASFPTRGSPLSKGKA